MLQFLTDHIFRILAAYVLLLAFLYGASHLFGDSRAGKLARRGITIMTAGLLLVIQKGFEKLKSS